MIDRSPEAGREPQLDGLRCLAFLAVFGLHARESLFPWGWGGVQFFFALSGFLITRILVRGATGRIGGDLRRYYLRRSLRIFPLYYLTIALLWGTGLLGSAGWLLTFSYNILGFWQTGIDPTFGHFWTLCVEEQFYLLYPLVLLATPVRARFAVLGVLIAGTIAFQVYAHTHYNFRAARILLPYCGEDLLWGCVAGLVDLRLGPGHGRLGTACFLAGWPLLWAAWHVYEHHWPIPVPLPTVWAVSVYGIANALIVLGASRTDSRLILGVLSFAPLTYLGRISYGLYLLHMPILASWYYAVPYSFLIPKPWGALAYTIVLASLTWRYFERPINRLKDRWGDAVAAAPGGEPGGRVAASSVTASGGG